MHKWPQWIILMTSNEAKGRHDKRVRPRYAYKTTFNAILKIVLMTSSYVDYEMTFKPSMSALTVCEANTC